MGVAVNRLVCALGAAVSVMLPIAAQAGLQDELARWDSGQAPVAACMVAWDECRTLASGGDARAQFLVGYAYTMGLRGKDDSLVVARRWLERAAAQRMPSAMMLLGRLHRESNGTADDIVAAGMWFELAETLATDDQTRYSAQYAIDEMKWHMTEEQVVEAKRMARDWLARHPHDDLPPVPASRPEQLKPSP